MSSDGMDSQMYILSSLDLVLSQLNEADSFNMLFEKSRKIISLLIKCDDIIFGMSNRELIDAYKAEDRGLTQRVNIKNNKSRASHNSPKW